MVKRLGERILDYIPGLLLMAWGLFIYWLNRGDVLTLYISRRLEWMVKLAAVGGYVLGGFLLIQAIFGKSKYAHDSDSRSCSCAHDHEDKPSMWQLSQTCSLLLLLVPFIMAWIWPPSVLGSQAAALKGVDYNPSSVFTNREKGIIAAQQNDPPQNDNEVQIVQVENTESQKTDKDNTAGEESKSDAEALQEEFPSDSFTKPYADYAKKLVKSDEMKIPEGLFIETIMTLDLYQKQFVGKRVTLEGFVHVSEVMKKHQFAVTRFAIQCCAADSIPYGLLVTNNTDEQVKKDEWVRASGILELGKFGEHTVLMLKVDRLQEITSKKDPYVYQNLEFGRIKSNK